MILNFTEYIELKQRTCVDLHNLGRELSNLHGRDETVRNRELANLYGRQTDEAVRVMNQYIISNLFTPEWTHYRTTSGNPGGCGTYPYYYFAAQIFTQLGFEPDTEIGVVSEALVSGRVSLATTIS